MNALRGWRIAFVALLVFGIVGLGGYALAQMGPGTMGPGGMMEPGQQQGQPQQPGQQPGPGMMGPGMMGSGGQMGPGMMGSGMMGNAGGMMGGQMDGPVQSTSPSAARALSQQAVATATIDRQTKTITYHSAHVQIVALASPDTGPNMTWSVEGLVNPTIVVPKDAEVTVHFFNADTGIVHGWELTATPPPYPDMAMMYAAVALPDAFAMPVAPPTAETWFGRTVQFAVPNAGTFYYICPVPGHAQRGMYGRLVVG